MSYTFCRVIWAWISKDPKVKKWVGDHNDIFTDYFSKYLCLPFLLVLPVTNCISFHIRVNKVFRDLQGHQDKLENRKDQMTLSFRKEIRWVGHTHICECVIKLHPLLLWLIAAHILPTAEVLYFFLRVLNIPGLSTFPLIEIMPVTLVVTSLSKLTILKKLS